MLFKCWARVVDADSKLKQYWVNVYVYWEIVGLQPEDIEPKMF